MKMPDEKPVKFATLDLENALGSPPEKAEKPKYKKAPFTPIKE